MIYYDLINIIKYHLRDTTYLVVSEEALGKRWDPTIAFIKVLFPQLIWPTTINFDLTWLSRQDFIFSIQ